MFADASNKSIKEGFVELILVVHNGVSNIAERAIGDVSVGHVLFIDLNKLIGISKAWGILAAIARIDTCVCFLGELRASFRVEQVSG
ncbi:MAG: hypothetical protein SGARI_003839, partial [Bacillariaceae sp.]